MEMDISMEMSMEMSMEVFVRLLSFGTSQGRGPRTRALALVAVVLPAAMVLSAGASPAAAAAAASAAGVTATYSSTTAIAAPPSSNFSGAAGGDGWAVGLTSTQVFNVFHHSATLEVACHNQSDAANCWTGAQAPSGFKTITDGSGGDFATSSQPGLWVDQHSAHVFVFATRSADQTAGVVCIDATASPSVADPFCGFTALSGVGQAPIAGGISQVSDPVVAAGNWYAFNYVNGTPTGSEDEMMCFSLTSLTACPGQPFAVGLGLGSGGAQIANRSEPEPAIAVSGTEILVPTVLSFTSLPLANELGCFNAANLHNCAGNWPQADSFSYPSQTPFGNIGGAAFPMLDAAGTPIGFCIPTTGDPCLSLAGNAVTTPPGMTTAVLANATFDGTAVVIGPRVYVPDGTFSGPPQPVACYDFARNAGCENTPVQLQNLNILYTVNPDPQRPTCLWVNSDSGSFQIQNFDAYTGAACGHGNVRVLASSVVVPDPRCAPTNFLSIQIVAPARSAYGSGSVQFEAADGEPLPGEAVQPLDATGSVDLSNLGLTTKDPLPQFLINLTGAPSNLGQVVVKLTWTAAFSTACLQPGTTILPPPPPSPGPGYRLEGGDGGVFGFNESYEGSVGFPSPPGLGLHLSNFVGMAATNGGYWLVQRNGGVFSFGAAHYHGSLPAIGITDDDITGIAATPDGGGYWLTDRNGAVFAFGDAPFHGSMGGIHLNRPIVGIAATPNGRGYWLVASDGGIFAFNAPFFGSTGSIRLNQPIVGMTAAANGTGYWLVAGDGGIFAFNAPFFGSTGSIRLNQPIVGMAASPDRHGYWLVASDGGVFSFGDAPFQGSCPPAGSGCNDLAEPIVAITS
jgi:hypothetical protein